FRWAEGGVRSLAYFRRRATREPAGKGRTREHLRNERALPASHPLNQFRHKGNNCPARRDQSVESHPQTADRSHILFAVLRFALRAPGSPVRLSSVALSVPTKALRVVLRFRPAC